ncbi:S-layer homology domain-containing protein [Paenibacillus oenotherae]|uniref:S-layer homology domain-containing protein n=1 Tax=Paenibacillus oenotherae TaxID=1435645 RepID=A0ABS7D2H0_9BACL|nr:S-layer homology domain-containing protein [Paenibacillus oenotherae]MBW7474127.1 S-layer homology domain-containing protein [Paenibacillus oenotherae]
MPQQQKWFKLITTMIVFSLLSGMFLFTGSSEVSAASKGRFSDVPVTHWADKHITKLALQGIIEGGTDGTFKPGDNVSQQEAVVMAIRFMGKKSEVQQDSLFVGNEHFKVGNFFKPYIAYAFQHGLLDEAEEYKIAEADTKIEWGARKASREWITKLMIRAIGQKKMADSLATSPVAFSDAKQVAAAYQGYVNAAVSLQLVKGITADKFDPKGSITRAALATMFSRAEGQFEVDYIGQQSGIASALSGSSLTLYRGNGESTFGITSDTRIYRHDSEKAVSLADLNPHTNVMIIADGAAVLYVEQLDNDVQIEKFAATFDRLLPNEHIMYVWVDNKPVEIVYDNTLVVKDASGTAIAVSALTKDSKIEITRDKYRAKPLAASITVQSAPVNKSGSGKVQSVQASPPALTVVDSVYNKAETLNVSANADIIWQGSILQGGITQVRQGDTIAYEMKDSVVTRIAIQQTTAKSAQGHFYSASSDSKTIQFVKSQGTAQEALEAKFIADSIEVTIAGLTNATIADLVKGDQLELTLNDRDQVSAIKVISRKVEIINGAVVVSYDADLKLLVVTNNLKKPIPVYLSDKTKIEFNGNTMTVDSIGTMLTKNRKLTLGYTDDKAVLLQFVYRYTGTVSTINTTSSQITMAVNGTPVTLGLESFMNVEIAGKTTAALADVKSGDTVTALLNANQDKTSSILVHTYSQYEVTGVDAAAKKVKLKGSDQVTTEVLVTSVDLFNERGEKITINNLSAGQIVNAAYVGKTLSSLKTVAVSIGTLTSLAADKIVVTDYNGSSLTVPLGASYSVIKDGATGGSASVLKIGDRIEVRNDAKDAVVITVISGQAKKFWKYDASSKVLSVRRANVSDNNYQFNVTDNTKVTSGGTASSLSGMKDGDSITVYVYKGTLLEVVK